MTDKPAGAEYVCVPRETFNYLRGALSMLPEDALGFGNFHEPQDGEETQYPILRELQERIDACLAASPRPATDAGVIERAKHLVELVECQVTRDGEIDEADKQELIVRIAGLLKGAEGGEVYRHACRLLKQIWPEAELHKTTLGVIDQIDSWIIANCGKSK